MNTPTKPAHTPTPALKKLLRVVDALRSDAECDKATDKQRANNLEQVAYEIAIERETSHAELVAVLERCHGMFQQSPLNRDDDWLSSQLARDIRAALAKSQA